MNDPMSIMTEEECWEFLRSHEFGRLAFHLAGEVHITPINYAVHNEPVTGHRSLLFRTAGGSKLLGVVMNDDVAFEVDEYGDEKAASVIIRGKARKLDEDEEHKADNVPLRPWVNTLKYNIVEIEPFELSGRRFELTRPWKRMFPQP